jgi:hypothetical protein
MNLSEQYPSRRVRQLLGFPRSLLYRTPADAADLRAALLRLFTNEKVYHESTRAASAGPPKPNRRPQVWRTAAHCAFAATSATRGTS